jgi:hypothetical protein
MPIKHSANPDHVRELCQQLKPILGEKMENIFEAYMVEDEIGKQQYESYLELLQAKYLPLRLDDDTPVFIPPPSESAKGEFKLGTIVYGKKAYGTFGLSRRELTEHCAIVGRSGGGKTNAALVLCEQLVRARIPVWVTDWKRTYRAALLHPSFKDALIFTVGRSVSPIAFNPLRPPRNTDPKVWVSKIAQIVCHAYSLADGSMYILQRLIDSLLEGAGVYSGEVERWPTFQDLYDSARTLKVGGRENQWLASTLRALSAICFNGLGDVVNSAHPLDLEELLDRTAIMELESLPTTDKVFYVESLLAWVHSYRLGQQQREMLSHVFLLEECHNVISAGRAPLLGGQGIVETVLREIRELNESVIMVTQHPALMPLPALGNAFCVLAFNMRHASDVNAMARCLLLDEHQNDALATLPVGSALCKIQGRITHPFMIHIPEFPIRKGAVTDDMVREWMAAKGELFLSPPQVERSVAPHSVESSCVCTPAPSNSVDGLVLAFLSDIASYADSGVALRYKRLGMSVRQGQKAKVRLLESGLIEDQEELTHVGRIRKIRLTEKGQRFLEKNRSVHNGNGAGPP